MYTTIPESWRDDFGPNVTLQELNDALVTLHIPAIVFFGIVMVIGVFGNLAVLFIYFRYPPSFFRVFILWLGVIDLIACSVGTPLLIVSMLHPYMFPSAQMCQTFRFVHVFLVVSAVFIFVFISVERHRAICNVERVEMNNRRVHTLCFLCCVLGLAVAIPAIFVYGDSTVATGVNNITGTECFIDDTFGEDFLPKSYFIVQLLLWVFSLLVMIIKYVQIGRRLNWHLKFTRSSSYQPPKSTKRTSKSNKSTSNAKFEMDAASESAESTTRVIHTEEESKVDRFAREITEMLCVVTVVFVLSFLPHLVLIVMNSLQAGFSRDMTPMGVIMYNIFLRSFVVNNTANPVIYMFCQRDFRKDCRKLLKNIVTCNCR